MKRKNITLTNMFLFVVTGVLLLLTLNFLEVNNLKNSLGSAFFQTVEDSLRGVREYILTEERLTYSLEDEELDLPKDISVLYLENQNMHELNDNQDAQVQSQIIQEVFLNSNQAAELLASKSDQIKIVSYKNQTNRKYSFYISITFLDDESILLLSKNIGAYHTFLRNNRIIFSIILLMFVGVFIYIYFLQHKKIQKPIKEMTEVAYQYSENNFDAKTSTKTNDEIGNLASAISKLGKAMEASTLMNTQEKELLEHVYDSLNVGVIYIDDELMVKSMNSTGQQYFASFIKSDDLEMSGGIKESYAQILADCFKNKTGQRIEVQQNQMIFDIRFSTLLSEENDLVSGVLLLIEDVTYAKRLASMREDLITNVSHDFRTPLSTIKGYSEAILDDIAETTEEKNEMAKIIYDEATELNKTINNLLDLSRIKAGYVYLNYQMVHLESFFIRLKNRFKETLEKENIVFSISIEDNLDYLLMDEEKMHHVFYNLIDNAIRYAADPETRSKRFIKINIQLDNVLDQALIQISDNGIGITQESIPFIFERFYKDDKSRSRPVSSGSGIGLSLVHSIINEHKGEIEVESTQDVGTNFIITLPYAEEQY